jgi:pyroglutamyl-peptidase
MNSHRNRDALVYGFGRFAGVERNPSENIVHWFGGVEREGVRIHAEVLPVSYRETRKRLEQILRSAPFELVLGFGVAVGATDVRIERFARNRADMTAADVDGRLPDAESIQPGAAELLPAGIDVTRMKLALTATGAPCSISDHAGLYLCNYAFYLTSHLAGVNCRVGFVHLPMATEFMAAGDRTFSLPLVVLRDVASAYLDAAQDLD